MNTLCEFNAFDTEINAYCQFSMHIAGRGCTKRLKIRTQEPTFRPN
jgi:hypothetical protein